MTTIDKFVGCQVNNIINKRENQNRNLEHGQPTRNIQMPVRNTVCINIKQTENEVPLSAKNELQKTIKAHSTEGRKSML